MENVILKTPDFGKIKEVRNHACRLMRTLGFKPDVIRRFKKTGRPLVSLPCGKIIGYNNTCYIKSIKKMSNSDIEFGVEPRMIYHIIRDSQNKKTYYLTTEFRNIFWKMDQMDLKDDNNLYGVYLKKDDSDKIELINTFVLEKGKNKLVFDEWDVGDVDSDHLIEWDEDDIPF